MLLGALLPDSRARAWLRSVAVPAAVVRFCDSPADLSGAAAAGAASCIIDLEAAPSAYDPHAVARAVRLHAPHVSIVGYCERSLVAPECVFAWVRAGVNDVLRRDDARPHAARAQLAAAAARGEAGAVFARIKECVPAVLQDVVACALAGVHGHAGPVALAQALGVPERTLRARLARAGGPSPRELVQWARLLIAVERLVHTPLSVERVADALGFASAPALYNALRRYTGESVATVRATAGRCVRPRALLGGVRPRGLSAVGTMKPPGLGLRATP